MHLKKRGWVTRGAGFLGLYLCARPLKEKDEVIDVDNVSTKGKGEYCLVDVTYPFQAYLPHRKQ